MDKIKLAIVEDNPQTLAHLKNCFDDTEYDVVFTASDGLSAVALQKCLYQRVLQIHKERRDPAPLLGSRNLISLHKIPPLKNIVRLL